MSGFKKFPIPIPSLAEQERIVDILDKFDALTSSITEGLPREIELRQKQYEYYRNASYFQERRIMEPRVKLIAPVPRRGAKVNYQWIYEL